MPSKLSLYDRERSLEALSLYRTGLSMREVGMRLDPPISQSRVSQLLRLGSDHGLFKRTKYVRTRGIAAVTPDLVQRTMAVSRSRTECARRLQVDPRSLQRFYGDILDQIITERGSRIYNPNPKDPKSPRSRRKWFRK